MASDTFLYCRVPVETKSALIALARHQGLTGSGLLRHMIQLALHSANAASIPIEVPLTTPSPQTSRIAIRLPLDARLLLRERALARGMPMATYVSVLVRAHLHSAPPLPKQEYLALRKTLAELGSIGRNLNQIARTANQGGVNGGPDREAVKAMIRVSEGLRDHVRALLAANLNSWSVTRA